MSAYDFPPFVLPPDQLDRILGVQSFQDQPVPQVPQLTPLGSALSAYSGLEDQPVHGRTFLEALLSGVGSGLGSVGTRFNTQRATLQQKANEATAANVKGHQELRLERGKALSELSKQQREAKAAQDKFNMENNPELIRKKAMAQAEGTAQGKQKVEGTTPDETQLSDAALKKLVELRLAGGPDPTFGMGKNGVRNKVRYYNMLGETPGTGADIATNLAAHKAEQANLQNLTRQLGTTSSAIETFKANSQTLRRTLGKVVDTGIPVANAIVRPGMNRLLGSKDISDYNTALSIVQPEAARILTQGPSGGGQLHQAAREELQAVINGNFTKPQLLGVLDILDQDTANRSKSLSNEVEASKFRLSNIGTPSDRTVKLKSPDGKSTREVPASQAEYYILHGARMVP